MIEKTIKNKTLVIAGPTASGKTGLAVKLASKLNGTIISADSRQIYKTMDIGTGKDLFEYNVNGKQIPHELIDVANPNEIYSLFNYLEDAYTAISKSFKTNTTPIICGGTGLYIEAILNKYKVANVPEDVSFREELMKLENEILVNRLKNESLQLYKSCDIKSKKRVVRALEIAKFQSHSTVTYSSDNAPQISPLILVTRWDTEVLKDRITKRLKSRLAEGMVKEVEKLMATGIEEARLNMFGMEYRQLGRYIRKEISYSEMFNTLQREIFRLAKRQRTWFRGMEKRGLDIFWVDNADFGIASEIVKREWGL
jgi:tRNA dimethylallyltransferase